MKEKTETRQTDRQRERERERERFVEYFDEQRICRRSDSEGGGKKKRVFSVSLIEEEKVQKSTPSETLSRWSLCEF